MNDGPVLLGNPARPFPGLRPFGYEDREFYFGRASQIYSLYRMLDRSRFVAVVGSSGSGKSSLAFAGLRPLLEKDSTQTGGRQWMWRQMSPKNAPIEGLIDLVYDIACSARPEGERDPAFLGSLRGRIAYLIRLSSHGLVDALAEIEGLEGKTPVLLVDQFEELFRYARSSQPQGSAKRSLQREEAVLFVQLLLAASRDPASRAHIVLTMRSDFIGDCAAFRGLPEAVSETQFLVPALTRDQLEEVIRKPIEKCGATIDSRLVERLLNDISDESDQLPVLQHCLLRLWEAAGKPQEGAAAHAAEAPRHISVEHYAAIGRIAGALSKHADEVLAGLAGREPVVERTFRSLSAIDKEGRATRREVTFARLIEETGDSEENLRSVLDRFRADDCSFLRPPISERPVLAADTPVDVGHEALLRRWEKVCGDPEATGAASDPRPVGWLREEEEDGRHYQALLYQNELPPSQVKDTLSWWTKRPRTSEWADRYGGNYARVKKLLEDGKIALARQLKFKWLTRGAVVAVCLIIAGAGVMLYMYYEDHSAQQQRTTTALKLGGKLFTSILNDLNRGDISSAAAREMASLAGDAVKALQSDSESQTATSINQSLTVSDIYATVGDNDDAYKEAVAANASATRLAATDPNNAGWQELLYGSQFRIGDILVAPGPQEDVQKGLAIYQQAQGIAQKLVGKEPGDGNRLYDLAFIDNKVGETLQQLNKSQDAMVQFNAALKIANQIAALPSAAIEWQAYPAATLTKIGRALVDSGSLDQGIAAYNQAITLQDGLRKNSANNDIVSSNLLTSHRLKGDALVQQGKADPSKYPLAFAEFDVALAIANQLVDKDAGNANWLTALAVVRNHYGGAKKASGDLSGALAQYQQEVLVWNKLVNKDATNPVWRGYLTGSQKRVADVQAAMAQGGQPQQNPPPQSVPAKPQSVNDAMGPSSISEVKP